MILWSVHQSAMKTLEAKALIVALPSSSSNESLRPEFLIPSGIERHHLSCTARPRCAPIYSSPRQVQPDLRLVPDRPMSKHKKKKHKDASSKKKMLPAQVEAVEWIGERFRLVDILAEGCRGAKWQPGAKLKIEVGEGMKRTYTPIAINAQSGRVR